MRFEKKIIRRIVGPKKFTENTKYKRRMNAELRELFNETDSVLKR